LYFPHVVRQREWVPFGKLRYAHDLRESNRLAEPANDKPLAIREGQRESLYLLENDELMKLPKKGCDVICGENNHETFRRFRWKVFKE